MNRRDHIEGCAGWEDCECFHITIGREEHARILAQRDRLAECLKMARNWIHDRDGDPRFYDAVLAELDKEKQS